MKNSRVGVNLKRDLYKQINHNKENNHFQPMPDQVRQIYSNKDKKAILLFILFKIWEREKILIKK